MKKFITGIVLIAATASMAFAGEAAGARQYGGRRAELRREAFRSLHLTEAQRQQIRSIREADRASNADLYRTAHAKRAEYRELRKNNDPRADSVKAELEALRPQLRAAHEALNNQLRSVLTPEQQAQLDARRQSHRGAK